MLHRKIRIHVSTRKEAVLRLKYSFKCGYSACTEHTPSSCERRLLSKDTKRKIVEGGISIKHRYSPRMSLDRSGEPTVSMRPALSNERPALDLYDPKVRSVFL